MMAATELNKVWTPTLAIPLGSPRSTLATPTAQANFRSWRSRKLRTLWTSYMLNP